MTYRWPSTSRLRWLLAFGGVFAALAAVPGCSDGMEPFTPVDGGTRADRVVVPVDDGGDGGSANGDGGSMSGDVVTPPMRCMSDPQCDDSVACTIDTCDVGNGRCIHVPDVARCECDPSCTRRMSGGGMGPTGGFMMEGQRGVQFDMASGGLLVRAESRRADYLWVPNTAESTISKWDATTNTEIARYRVGVAAGECLGRCCHEANCNMTSRVVVDGRGDAYVANRGFAMQGTVAKIAADRRDCVDRNGNGMIDTSANPMDVRPLNQDECVLWNQPVGPVNAVLRSLAIDRGDESNPDGFPWVGSCSATGALTGNQGLFKLDPRTGTLIRAYPFAACAYGAVVTPDGTLWEHTLSNGITPVNTTTGAVGTHVRAGTGVSSCTGGSYGITADARGRIWLSRTGCRDAVGYDPRTGQWTLVNVMAMGATAAGLGITVDSSNRMWLPSNNQLFSWDSDAFVGGGSIPAAAITRHALTVPAGWTSTSAVGADRSGAIWVTTQNAGPLLKFNPMTNTTQPFAGPNRVYTYTDFTGAVRRLVIGTGTYEEQYMAECEMPAYADLTWRATTPVGTSLQFVVRVANTEAGLAMATPVTLAVAPRDSSPIAIGPRLMAAGVGQGRYARLSVTFTPTNSPVQSPVLHELGLSWRCTVNPG
ncbi:MAG: hypothetical protein Q8Q09_04170 [Deltaproteobacteria bacterium]|nr:hypothetical protein [Deltaproteobacteria bacterium]